MPEMFSSLTIPTLIWMLALIQAILSLYFLFSYFQSSVLRYLALSLGLLALNTFALGLLSAAGEAASAWTPALLLATTSPLLLIALFQALLAWARPHWMTQTIVRLGRILLWGFGFLPGMLSIADVLLQRKLWFTPLESAIYRGGYVPFAVYTSGSLRGLVNGITFGAVGALLIAFLVYLLLSRRATTALPLWTILLLIASSLFLSLAHLLPTATPWWLSLTLHSGGNLGVLASYLTAGLQLAPTEPRLVKGSFQQRIVVLVFILTLPLLSALSLLLSHQMRLELERNASQSLASLSINIVQSSNTWLAYTNRALRTLVANPDIISMEAARQEPHLRAMATNYPDIYLVSTLDTEGKNVARSDGGPLLNYGDRPWFREAVKGLPISTQVSVTRASGEPTLIVAMPILNARNQVVGVAMYAADLSQVERVLRLQQTHRETTIFFVNERNQLLASSTPIDFIMADMSAYPPVKALRQGVTGSYRFTDITGERWVAHLNVLNNHWGLVVQERESDLLAPIRNFRRLSLMMLGLSLLILSTLTWVTVRQALLPVRLLTETATAIASGDLSRQAPQLGQDELGTLAQAFNSMTAQLRDLIATLERRVSERTAALEKRAHQLQATADLARQATSLLGLERLLQEATRLISERLGFYHVGIFLIETGGPEPYAVLRAANSTGGQRMLEQGHRLKVGREGIVGYVAASGQPRIALDVGQDAVYFSNPYLPLTRSEVALPLKVEDRVIGVLDVQSELPEAFNEEDLSALQILADQLAIAIENARLLGESQQALRELEYLYGRQIRQGWRKRLQNRPLTYLLDSRGYHVDEEAQRTQITWTSDEGKDSKDIIVPLELRGSRLGRLRLKRPIDGGEWSPYEVKVARDIAAQLAQALENARLLEEIQNRAAQEELINQIIAHTQSTLQLDVVLRNAVQEIARAVNAARVQIRLGSGNGDGSSRPDKEVVGEGG